MTTACMPTLSIITSTYNAAATIAHCIESVAMQTIPVEHIIIDGASTDGTLDVIRGFADRLGRVVSEPDRGMYDAMNKGIALARGDVIGILNADDFYPRTDVLERVRDAFVDSAVATSYGDLLYVDSVDIRRTKRIWKAGDCTEAKFYWGWMPPHPTFFVRRSLYETYGDFDLRLGSAADYELMLRFLLRQKVSARYIPEVLVHMRSGGVSNASLRNRIKANRMDRLAWRVNGLRPSPWTVVAKPLIKIPQWIKCVTSSVAAREHE